MVCELTQGDLRDAFFLAWELCQKKETNSYPIYPEPGDLQDALIGSIKDPNDQVLGCFDQEELIGVCMVFPMEEDSFLQTNGFYITGKFEYAAGQFIRYLQKKYKGYRALFGFPKENTHAGMFFYEMGGRCVESSYTLNCAKARFRPSGSEQGVHRLKKEQFAQYAPFHDQYAGDIYWNSERLWREFPSWRIYTYEEKKAWKGSLFMHVQDGIDAEIFGVFVAEGMDVYKVTRRLLSRALRDLFTECPNVIDVIYFVEDDSTEELRAALESGFWKTDSYKCYELQF